MATARLALSYGQAFVAPERHRQRSSMSVRLPEEGEPKGACALISDSASGHALAKQAGDLSVRGFLNDYYATPSHWTVKASAQRVIRSLNAWCHGMTRQMDSGSYVSSLSAVVFKERSAHLFHVGDTLVFRLRGAEFEQLSRDHVTDLGGYRYPARALGMDVGIDIDYTEWPLKQGDIFLFTTQGVRGTLLPSDYVRLIREDASDLDAACERLAAAAGARAGERGYGSDPFCFQLVRVDELPDVSPDAPSRLYGDLPIPPELAPGNQIDGLLIEEVLSRTAHSRVYRVRDLQTDRICVLKAPSPELSNRNAYLEHFLLQQWVVERVHSPFVVSVVEPSRQRRHLYYLMRHVEGMTLSQWVARFPRASLGQRLDIALQLGKAIQALHNRDLIHQQIHPDNVLIDEHGQVVLADFSACHLRDVDGHRRSRRLVQQVGLNEHSAPEYALDDEVGRRSDQYALASTVYWLLSGQLPYDIPTHQLRSHTDLEQLSYRSVRSRRPDVSQELDEALKRALDPQRSLRFRRLSEFLYSVRPSRQQPKEQAPRSIRAWQEPANLWQGIAGVLLVLLVLSWWLR
ncbi:bifunctional serine/threonine-protein phosphatase/kinase [Halomonas denitrificans]|uniref:bifunctional protein-serine/threonine kinase/phosphatase n=1 Tax=Halomonas TaxID=2745 RepID=UPI001A8F0EAC|nr:MULTISPECIES: bifunctional protein-serine/threonine kinase/phosphatase [Halomonas]MED5295732.1 protein kinase [Pseudomonadota bacterium]MBN8413493.1 protein kinase [Halomonas litopenaei]MBY5926091.1 protein kinase [Halomonas sp. DP4Y7-2]MBY5984651.1 protein kinase [Halomonas sp. DP5Y7-2]MBY6030466.1 protein kinase [Halomonas sp. DP8Y7-1]